MSFVMQILLRVQGTRPRIIVSPVHRRLIVIEQTEDDEEECSDDSL